MLYHRLLSGLLDTTNVFDFPALWARLDLNPSAPFSSDFIQQTAAVMDAPSVPVLTCLADVVGHLRAVVGQMEPRGIDTTLQVIYRSQNKYWNRKSRNKGKGREGSAHLNSEAEELAAAIEMSLKDTGAPSYEADLVKALLESLREAGDTTSLGGPLRVEVDDSNLAKALLESVQGSSSGLVPAGVRTPPLDDRHVESPSEVVDQQVHDG
jgi:exonuclease V